MAKWCVEMPPYEAAVAVILGCKSAGPTILVVILPLNLFYSSINFLVFLQQQIIVFLNNFYNYYLQYKYRSILYYQFILLYSFFIYQYSYKYFIFLYSLYYLLIESYFINNDYSSKYYFIIILYPILIFNQYINFQLFKINYIIQLLI